MVTLLSIPAYCRLVNRSRRTIEKRMKAGVIPFVQIGGVGQRLIPDTALPDVLRVDDRETRKQRAKRVERAKRELDRVLA